MKRNLMLLLAVMVIFAFPNDSLAAPEQMIKIGIIGPMKFTAGLEEWGAAQLAAEEINNLGGIMVRGVRHKVELIKADSNEMRSVSDAVSAMERLITVNKVNFVIGGFRTEAVLAMQEVIADHKKIFLSAAGSPKLPERVKANYDRYKYWFRGVHLSAVFMSPIMLGCLEVVIDKMREDLGIAKPRVAILVDKIEIGEPLVSMAEATIPKIGGEVAGIWRTSPFATDLTAELTAIKAAGAHVIYTFTTGPSGTVFIKQWGEIQFTAPVVGHTTDGSSKKFWVSTGGMCNYIASYGQSGRVEMTDKSIPFYDKLSARTGDYPSDHTGTYEVLYILKEAIERTGTLDSDAVVVALEKTDHIGPSGRSVYNPNDHKWPHELIWGPGYRTSLGNQWQNGELKTFWPRGKAVLGDKKWEGVRYKGTVDYQLPPWVIKYWKSK